MNGFIGKTEIAFGKGQSGTGVPQTVTVWGTARRGPNLLVRVEEMERKKEKEKKASDRRAQIARRSTGAAPKARKVQRSVDKSLPFSSP